MRVNPVWSLLLSPHFWKKLVTGHKWPTPPALRTGKHPLCLPERKCDGREVNETQRAGQNLEQAPEPTLASASRDAAIDQSLALDTFLDKCPEASQIPRRLIAKQDENCG
jgi:hypothetical protein